MNFEQIIENLEKKIYHPVYVLYGEEPYFIDVITDHIQDNVLTDVEKEFNLTVLYGRDTSVAAVQEYARRVPMMANYHVVVVREAQDLDNIEKLESLFKYDLSTTILVIAFKYKKIDKRKTFAKAVASKGVLFESRRIYDNQVPGWISAQVVKSGYSIAPNACELLAEYLGADLEKIRNELEKLTINIPAGSRITEEIIERNIGISKEYNIFELQRALGRKDVVGANRIILNFAANPRQNPLILVITVLFNYFSKLLVYHQLDHSRPRNEQASVLSVNPVFLRDYEEAARNYSQKQVRKTISILREFDLRSKGYGSNNAEEGELLKEMVYKILH